MGQAARHRIKGISKFPETQLPKAHRNIIYLLPVKKIRIITCMHTADYNRGA